MIAAIVLAAGSSHRLGQPKQLVELAGESLLHRAVRTAHEAGCSPIIVVLGAHHTHIVAQSDLPHAITVVNSEWQEGMASSIRLGLQSIQKPAQGTILLTCDQPAVSAHHLRLLMASRDVTASAYAGRQGVPAYFPASAFPKLLKLTGDAGARDLLQTAACIDLPDGELDIDTPADLAKAKLLYL